MDTASSKPANNEGGISQSTPARRGARPDTARADPRREREMLLGSIGRLWIAFVRGQLTLIVIIGVVTWVGMAALGVRWAPYLGAMAGSLEIVPSLGPVLATAAAAIVALRYGSSYLPISNAALAGLVIVFAVLLQQLENLLIVPRVMGDALKLPALVVLVGVVVGAAIGGVVGAVLAAPLIATAREILRYAYRKRRGQEPFAAGEETRD
jgi:predicted PurR-regulated permease PerM